MRQRVSTGASMSILKSILPPAWNKQAEETFVLEDWRHWFGGLMSLIFLVLLPIVYLVDFPYFLANEHYGLIALDSAVWLLLLARVLFPAKRTFYSRHLWLLVIYAMAVSFLVILGPTYARAAWLVFCVVMTALFFGPKAAFFMSFLNGALLMVLYGIMDTGNPAWTETYRLGFNHWLVFAVSASLLSLGASIPVGFLLVRLDEALRRAKAANEELAGERAQLGRAHDDLQKQMRETAMIQMALMESEEKLRLMADNLPNTVIYQVVADKAGGRRFVYMSRSIERLNEVTAEEVMADASVLYGQVAPECVEELAAKEAQALESLTTFRHTTRSILPSGRMRWFDLAATPRKNQDGSITWDGVQVDVTEREQAKQALRESEELYRVLVENSHAGIAMVDDAYHYVYVNDEFCRILGFEHDELLGADVRDLWAEETYQIVDNHYRARQRGESPPPHYEVLMYRKDGVKRWLEVRASLITDASGMKRTVAQFLDVTERKESEDALRESEALHRAVVENSHDGIVVADNDYRFTYVNDEFCLMTGYPREELVGRDFRDFVAEETAHIPVKHYEARLRGEEPPPVHEFFIKRKDGQKRLVELKSSEFIGAKGGLFIVGQLLDITERKHAEQALRESERLYRTLVENSLSGVVLLDDNSTYEYVNDEYCRVLGYEREEIVGRDFRSFLAEETAHIPESRYKARQRGENPPARYEYMVVRKDGNKRWVEVSAAVFTDDKGRVHTVAQLLDITKRKKADQALRRSENLYRALAENSHAGIVLIDSAFHFTYVNDEFCKIMGYSREEFLGQDFRRFLAEETAHVPQEHYMARQRGEEPPARYEFMVVRKDGEKRWLETSSSIITDDKGEKSTLGQFLDVTERKAAEEALSESEALYRALAEHSHAGIVLVDDLYRIIFANNEFRKMTGYGHDELMNEKYGLIVAEEYKPILAQYFQARVCGENPPSRYEFLMRKKDGTKRWVEASVAMFNNERGKVFVLAQLLDISERKAAEEALKQSEQRFRASFDSSFQFTGLLTPDGRMLEANQAALEFIGMSMEEVAGMPFWLAPWWRDYPEQQERIKDAIRRAASGEFIRFEAENIGLGDERIYVDFSLKPIYGQDNEVVMLLPVGHDITGRVMAEEALRESEEKFRQVIQSSPMGIFMYELVAPDRLEFVGANPEADRILQLDTDFFMGKTVEEVFPMIAGTDLPKRMRAIAARGAKPIKNEPVEYDDGRIKGFFEIHVFQTAPGKLTVMFQDVAERKKAEKERARLESQLRQSQKMEAVGTLTSGIAHDFNNILGAILGTTETSLLKGNDQKSLQRNLGSIRDMSIRGRDLVRRLLSFSRQDEQSMRSMDIAELINESLEFIKATLPANVTLKKQLEEGLMVRADPVQMQQVLLNLCTNAAHAMEKGGGVLSIRLGARELSEEETRLHPDLRPGSHVLIEVSDTGSGISRHVMDRIFDPFFTTKPMGRGTGLGLSLAHGIIMSHHGAITVSSKEGEGTTMSLLLPREAPGEAAAERRQKPTALEGNGEHILVVDDEEIIARSTAQTLEAFGYRVSAYTSSLEAAAALEDNPQRYDAILTDHMMPGLTGRQLAEIAGELNPGLPVVLMTGMYGDVVNGSHAGEVAQVLTKPVTINEIGQAVRQVLDRRDGSKIKASA
jgi:two-component system cell cycle sensor histidine kinase/response regulator CckA